MTAFGIGVESEIGRLRRVFVHTPGREVEFMTPKTAIELLYNDILNYRQLREGHAQLKGVLGLVAEVLDVEDCLRLVLDNPAARSELVQNLIQAQGCPELESTLLELPSEDLARSLICGVPLRRDTLEAYLSSKSFSIVPLPNMYFMRDSSIVIGNRVVTSRMASPVRADEAIIMRTVYKYFRPLKSKGVLLDGYDHPGPDFSIEGGDVLVVNRNLLLIGLSERTTPRAVDALIDAWAQARHKDKNFDAFDVICVELPRERSTIHLDMIFTFVSQEQAVVFHPYILGRERCNVVRVRVGTQGDKRFTTSDDLLSALLSVGVRISPILCGGGDPLHEQREQWNSGANMVAFAPGKAISYGMHEHTVRACEQAGFRILHAGEVMREPTLLESSDKIIVTVDGAELARGGGGPRCMTCPVLRDPVE